MIFIVMLIAPSLSTRPPNSVWNHEASFLIPGGIEQAVDVEVCDSDKIGKDESLGKLSLDLANVVAMSGHQETTSKIHLLRITSMTHQIVAQECQADFI